MGLNIYRIFSSSSFSSVSFKCMPTDSMIISHYKEDPFIKRIDRICDGIGELYTLQLQIIDDYDYEFESLVKRASSVIECIPIESIYRDKIYEVSGRSDQTLCSFVDEMGNSCWPIINNITITDQFDQDYGIDIIWTSDD